MRVAASQVLRLSRFIRGRPNASCSISIAIPPFSLRPKGDVVKLSPVTQQPSRTLRAPSRPQPLGLPNTLVPPGIIEAPSVDQAAYHIAIGAYSNEAKNRSVELSNCSHAMPPARRMRSKLTVKNCCPLSLTLRLPCRLPRRSRKRDDRRIR